MITLNDKLVLTFNIITNLKIWKLKNSTNVQITDLGTELCSVIYNNTFVNQDIEQEKKMGAELDFIHWEFRN